MSGGTDDEDGPSWNELVRQSSTLQDRRRLSLAPSEDGSARTPRPVFASATDVGKAVVVSGGEVEVDGRSWAVEWVGGSTDGAKRIADVDDKLGGDVLLDCHNYIGPSLYRAITI